MIWQPLVDLMLKREPWLIRLANLCCKERTQVHCIIVMIIKGIHKRNNPETGRYNSDLLIEFSQCCVQCAFAVIDGPAYELPEIRINPLIRRTLHQKVLRSSLGEPETTDFNNS